MTGAIRASGLALEAGGQTLADGIDLTVAPGDAWGVVGPNGCGKTTLLRTLSGAAAPAAGMIEVSPSDATIGYLAQVRGSDVPPGATAAQVLAERTGVAPAHRAMMAAATAMADGDEAAGEEYASQLDAWLRLGGPDLDERAERVLAEIGAGVRLDESFAALSGGEQARVGLAGILLSRFDILLLDEPTNDLDSDGLRWLRDYLMATDCPIVVVSHDRRFLAEVTTGVIEFDPALRRVAAFDGGYDVWRRERARARQQAADAADSARAEVDELRRQAQAARQRAERGRGTADRKYATGRVDKMLRDAMREGASSGAAHASRLRRAADRTEVPEGLRKQWRLQFTFAVPITPGPQVVAGLDDVIVQFASEPSGGAGRTLGPWRARLFQGDRVLLHGPNGSGKSSLVRAMLGELPLAAGRAWVAPDVSVAVIDQRRRPPAEPVPRSVESPDLLNFCATALAQPEVEVRTLLAKFGLGPDEIGRTWNQVSPGERTRAAMAVYSLRPSHLLVLDEPTNHLDVDGIEALQAALAQYPGTVMVVSHDAEFVEAGRWTRHWTLADGRLTVDR